MFENAKNVKVTTEIPPYGLIGPIYELQDIPKDEWNRMANANGTADNDHDHRKLDQWIDGQCINRKSV